MKYYKDINNEVYAYEDDGSQDYLIGDKVKMTAEEAEAHINPPKTQEQILAQQIAEATAYLKDTDWVETYKLRHDLSLELIPETSTKWEVLAKREEYKAFLRGN